MTPPPYWTLLPFLLLLAAIALMPLVRGAAHWWESNLHRFYVAALLAAMTLAYYLFCHAAPLAGEWPAGHVTLPAAAGPNFALAWSVLAHAVLHHYLPFITFLFALYTISGGIRFESGLRARPTTNTLFLAAGAVLASLIGTTGAAMVLIRPLLETNRERKRVAHTVIFFIFIVCNCGGCLLPTGDPPLFLGYLRGVDFFWTLRLWPEWLLVNGALVAIYFLCDALWHYPREQPADHPQISNLKSQISNLNLRLRGVWPNGVLLAAVVAAVVVFDPGGTLPGTRWQPWPFLREAALLGLVGLSLVMGDRAVRRANQFNYAAILEVAVLFFGIFICMQPALQIISAKGPDLGLATPGQFFWSTGVLSSVLDNAPTYVVFFEAARTLTAGMPRVPAEPLLAAISLGAVFMGASSYIGNGPNFMVKAIAEKSGVRMPGFFCYMLYGAVILLPLFALSNWLFLR